MCEHNNKDHHHHHPEGSAEAIIDSSLIYSNAFEISLSEGKSAEELVHILAERMNALSSLLAVNGDILGHIKALLSCKSGQVTISIVKLDHPVISRSSIWKPGVIISSFQLIIDCLSVNKPPYNIEPIVQALLYFPKEKQ